MGKDGLKVTCSGLPDGTVFKRCTPEDKTWPGLNNLSCFFFCFQIFFPLMTS